MSDHEHHDDHDDHGVGAHEVDKMPSRRLFNLLFGLSGLTLVASIGVVQLFYRQVDSIRDTRDRKVSFQLAEYRQEMDEQKNGWSVVEMADDDGVPEAEGGKSVHQSRRYQMPLAEARKRMLEQPQQHLKAGRPYRGWKNPDANAPKTAQPAGPLPRNPVRVPPRPVPPGADGQPPMGVVPPTQPVPMPPAEAPAEGKAPAKGEGKAEGKAPAPKREGKAEGKAPANE